MRDSNNKNEGDEDSICVDFDVGSLTLGITIEVSFDDIGLLLFDSFPLLFLSQSSLSLGLLDSVDITCFWICVCVCDSICACAIGCTRVYFGSAGVASDIIVGEYNTCRWDFSFLHVTDLYSFIFSCDNISLSFLIFSPFLVTSRSIISVSLKI